MYFFCLALNSFILACSDTIYREPEVYIYVTM